MDVTGIKEHSSDPLLHNQILRTLEVTTPHYEKADMHCMDVIVQNLIIIYVKSHLTTNYTFHIVKYPASARLQLD